MPGYGNKEARIIAPVTILINTAVSNPVFIGSILPTQLSVEFPSTWTAADLIIEVSRQHARRDLAATLLDANFIKLRDNTAAIIKLTSIPTNGVSVLKFPATVDAMQNYSWLRVRSVNTADVTQNANQAAARTLYLGLIRTV